MSEKGDWERREEEERHHLLVPEWTGVRNGLIFKHIYQIVSLLMVLEKRRQPR